MNENSSDLKRKILHAILCSIETELNAAREAAKSAHEAATHEEAKSEDKHDTRAIEAGYLAMGQAERTADLERAYLEFQKLVEQNPEMLKIGLGAVAYLESVGKKFYCLIHNEGGGTRLELDSKSIQVVNPQSPLGEILMDLKSGDEATLESKGGDRVYRILEVF